MSSTLAPLSGSFERRLYAGMSAFALSIVLVGFAKTYYLKTLFGAPSLPLLLHMHGALMTSWYLLFFIQVVLIRTRRVDLHRKLGLAGVAFAIALVPIAMATARQFLLNSLTDPELLPLAAGIVGYDAVALLVFAGLVAAALAWRRRSDIHKPLMTLAALTLLGPPLARLLGDENAVLASNLIVIVPIALDTIWNRRLHPAFAWGGALVLISSRVALMLVMTPSWTEFAVRMVS